jgi:hypothetical protein
MARPTHLISYSVGDFSWLAVRICRGFEARVLDHQVRAKVLGILIANLRFPSSRR